VRRLPLACALVAAALAAETSAWAKPRARLVYGRSEGALACPDEAALREAVAARVGYDPFFPFAPQTVIVTIARRGDALVGRTELVDDGARGQGMREISAPADDCGALVEALGLAVTIAIDPRALLGPVEATDPPDPPSSPATPPSVEDAATAAPTAPPSPADAPPRAQGERSGDAATVSAWSTIRAEVGAQPSVATAFAFGAAVGSRRFEVGLEGAASLPSATDASGGASVRAWLARASLLPCTTYGIAHACAVVSVGRLEGSSRGAPNARSDAALHAAAGARGGLSVSVARAVELRVDAEIAANLARASLRLGDSDAWTASPVLASIGFGASTRF